MAGWISSKLKVAETLLQQIDLQAAESLGKNEKPRSEELNSETPIKTGEVVPLKDQLKKRIPETSELNGNLRTDSNSDRLRLDPNKELGTRAKLSSNPKPTLTDSDWTELLSTPKHPTPLASKRSNGISEIRGPRKDTRKQGTASNLFPFEGKRNQKTHVSNSKSAMRSDIVSENRVNGGVAGSDGKRSSDGEESGSSDSVREKSNPELQNNDDYVGGSEIVRISTAANLLSEAKVDASQEWSVLDTPGDASQAHSQPSTEKDAVLQSVAVNHTIEPVSISGMIDGMISTKKETYDGQFRLKHVVGKINESNLKVENSISSNLPRGSSSASEERSDSDTDSTSSSESENERERKVERARRREQIMLEKAAAKAVEAIKERENIVARLEGEQQSLEKILEERAKQQAQEASELQTSMMETMEAVEVEKHKHNNTRMEALALLAKLETANADLARSLANTQRNLEVEVDRVVGLRQQIESKEAAHEDLRRRMSIVHHSGSSLNQLEAPKGFEFEREILEAEYSYLCDKIGHLQEKAKKLEENIEVTRKEIENPTEIEVELKRRLGQLTDHLIQKQAQVEALSSEKATLLFRIETLSRLLDENKSSMQLTDFSDPLTMDDLEEGTWKLSNSNLKPLFKDRIRSGGRHIGFLLRQLDAIFCAGTAYIRRNRTAKLWSIVYLICLHFWVLYIFMSHSQVSGEIKSGAVISLESINNTSGV